MDAAEKRARQLLRYMPGEVRALDDHGVEESLGERALIALLVEHGQRERLVGAVAMRERAALCFRGGTWRADAIQSAIRALPVDAKEDERG